MYPIEFCTTQTAMETINYITSFTKNVRKRTRHIPWMPTPTYDLNIIPSYVLNRLKTSIDEELTKRYKTSTATSYWDLLPPSIQIKIEAIATEADMIDQRVRDTVGKEVERIHMDVWLIMREIQEYMLMHAEWTEDERLDVSDDGKHLMQIKFQQIRELYLENLTYIQEFNSHFKGTREEYVPVFHMHAPDLSDINWFG